MIGTRQAEVKKIIEIQTQEEKPQIEKLWQFFLAGLLFAGIVLSYLNCVPMSEEGEKMFILAATAAILVCGLLSFFPRISSFVPALPLAAAAVWCVIYGITSIYGGFLGVINDLITWWNLRYEDGKGLIQNVKITRQGIEAFSIVLILVTVAVLWRIIQKKNIAGACIMIICFLVPGIVLNFLTPAACALLLTGGGGIWIYKMNGSGVLRSVLWTVGLGVVLCVSICFTGRGSIKQIAQVKEEGIKQVEKFRFGEDTLPQGNLYEADSMLKGNEKTLEVTTQQVKALYLRGFAGSIYKDGKWLEIKNSAFGGENAGMLKWLNKQNFLISAQYAGYINAQKQDAPKENQVKVINTGARKNYAYMPYSADMPKGADIAQGKDANIQSAQLFGTKEYTFSEWSDNIPSELMHVSDWVSAPKGEEQKKYLQAESVYRSFVYENYVETDERLDSLIKDIFWANADTEEKQGIYTSTQRIRRVLSGTALYKDEPEAVPEGVDPIRWFLTEGREGNSSLFASAAVAAFRSNGIPARYVEGYLLTEKKAEESKNGKVTLTNKDSHAWAEVYMDGIGWVPVDVTPGFYYDTYALMEMVKKPQGIQQTAALEETEEKADQVKEGAGGSLETKKTTVPKENLKILLGIFVMVLIILTVFFIIGELARLIRRCRLAHRYNTSPPEKQMYMLCSAVLEMLHVLGVNAQPGWGTKESEERLSAVIANVREGEYVRVSKIMEKHIFGEEKLMPHEERVLTSFVEKLGKGKKQLSVVHNLKIRYHKWGI